MSTPTKTNKESELKVEQVLNSISKLEATDSKVDSGLKTLKDRLTLVKKSSQISPLLEEKWNEKYRKDLETN